MARDTFAPIEESARGLLLALLLPAFLWLVLGSSLLLVHTVQLHSPTFFQSSEYFTFGRTHAAAEMALIYGWVGNASFAVAFWLLGRLGSSVPRGISLALIGTFFWNIGVAAGVVGIASGDMSGWQLFQMPSYVVLLLLVAGAAIGTTGILAWADRRNELAYASQWYAAAGLFCMPWILSVVAVMLHFSPLRGVAPAVVAAWATGGLQTLWLAPVPLAVAYYLIPKLGSRPVPAYGLALGAFWTLMLFGAWTGTRPLSGGPFPVWIPSVGIAAGIVLIIHYLIVAANLRGVFSISRPGVELRFLAIMLLCYVVGGLVDVVASFRSVAVHLQFTQFAELRILLLVFGVFSPAVFAACYWFIPRVTGREWPAKGLVDLHLSVSILGALALVAGLIGGGVAQAMILSDPAQALSQILQGAKPWLLCSSAGVGLELLGAVFILVNLVLQLLPGQPVIQQGAAPSNAQAS